MITKSILSPFIALLLLHWSMCLACHAALPAGERSSSATKSEKPSGGSSQAFVAECPSGNPKVVSVEILGLKNVPVEKARSFLTVGPGSIVTPALADDNARRLKESGYFGDGVEVSAAGISGGVRLSFSVTENPVVKNIVIKGDTLFGADKIRSVLQIREGAVFNRTSAVSDARSVQKLFDGAGYVMNRVSDISFDGETFRVIVEENRIEKIKVVGNDKTRTGVITREIGVKPGEMFEDHKVTKSLQRIFNLGYFSQVIPRCEPGSRPGLIDLIIEVREAKTGRYTAGGGYSSANGLVGILEIEEKNLGGRGQKANASMEFGGRRSYTLGFTEPNVKGSDYSLGGSVFKVSQEQKLYRPGADPVKYGEDRKGFSVTSGRQFTEAVSGTVAFRDEDVSITASDDAKAAVEQRYTRSGRYQTISASVSRDTRDNYLDPKKGSFSTLGLDTTGGFLKGLDSFSKIGLTLRKYHSLGARDVVAGRIAGGMARVSDGSLPLFERYGLGGVDSLRGYDYREFTGERMLTANLELRHGFSKTLGAHVFCDAGDAWGGADSGSGFSFRKGFGAGVIISTPIAPFRFDYARGKSGEGKFYFGMGRMF